MLRLRSVVDGAAEDVEDAAVHVMADHPAEIRVKGLGITASQFRHVPNSQAVEIGGYGRSDSGNGQEAGSHLSDHTASSFPLGSAKWNRRPPGNEKISFTIAPPAAATFACMSSRPPV
jgi:hypothetical protein